MSTMRSAGQFVRCALALVAAGALAACSSGPAMGDKAKTGDASFEDLQLAAAWMAGSFTSAEQAESDERYYEVLLHHAPIWTHRADGFWFSIEQAIASSADKPYRQRVYRLWLRPDHKIESTVYEMPEPERFIGAWRDPSVFDAISPKDLTERDGCAVVFTQILPDAFIGGTGKNSCESSLRGASYATSQVELRAGEIRSWDRGFDARGEHVWGAEAGPYVFRRVE